VFVAGVRVVEFGSNAAAVHLRAAMTEIVSVTMMMTVPATAVATGTIVLIASYASVPSSANEQTTLSYRYAGLKRRPIYFSKHFPL